MTKMGMHNKITAERFHTIKGALALGESNDEIMREYQIKNTTLRYIRNSKNFYEYRLKTDRCKRCGKIPPVVLPNCQERLIDVTPKTIGRWKKTKHTTRTPRTDDEKQLCFMAGSYITICLVIIAVMLGLAIALILTMVKG